jgi:hypothetical protein
VELAQQGEGFDLIAGTQTAGQKGDKIGDRQISSVETEETIVFALGAVAQEQGDRLRILLDCLLALRRQAGADHREWLGTDLLLEDGDRPIEGELLKAVGIGVRGSE